MRRRYREEEVRDRGPIEDERVGVTPVHDDTLVADDEVVERRPVYEETVAERRAGFSFYDSLPARVNTIVFTLLFALEALLTLRFLMVAFGANRTSGFVDFILDVSWPFVRPFDGAFSNRTWDQGVIEVSTLLAMGVWFIVGVILAMLINAIVPRMYDDGVGTTTRHRRVLRS